MCEMKAEATGHVPGPPGPVQKADPLSLARALVAVPSVNPSLEKDGTGETLVAELCAGWLNAWGFDVEVSPVEPGRPNVVARHAGARPGRTLLLNGHLDTVGVADMSVAAFGAEVHDGRLFGRGACDMKGGLAALLAAAHALVRERHSGELTVALTCDEEHASLGMASLVAGGLQVDAAIVCEPTGLSVMPSHKGFVWVEAQFEGHAAHGSRPDVGVDAIRMAGAFLAGLADLEAEWAARSPHPLLGLDSVHAGTIQGGVGPSVYPARCTLVLERRTLPGMDAATVVTELERLAERTRMAEPDLAVSFRVLLSRPGTEVPADHDLVRRLLGALVAEGLEPRVAGMTAWVDAAFLNGAGIPAVCFGPGSIEQAHAPDEWLSVEELRLAAAVLARFGGTFLEGS